ncbi:MAG TPA: alcohol dehydrogenase catalytic domain-containing protein [Candidatus Limiplasma sp.]|nr:alcohol dehydrogenase catalytic domain-containing protein [Candidatus Limiplasma sp.]
MKAMLWEGTGRLRQIEMPEPECKPDDLKIKVHSAGVCATDAHIVHGTFFNGDPPHVLGHEIAGEVVAVGNPALKSWEGKRIVVETAVGCGVCEHCRSGNKHLCETGGEIGFPPYQGGYAQYVCVPWTCAHVMPDSMSYDEGGILEAVACPVGAIRRIGLAFGETVLVQGAGVAGLSFIQAVRAASAGKVIATITRECKREQTLQSGADVVVNVKTEDLKQRVLEETGGKGVELSIDAVGAADTLTDAVILCAARGRVLLYGLPDEQKLPPFPATRIIMRQLTVLGVTNNEMAWEPLLQMVARGTIRIRDFVTHRYTLSQLPEAIEAVSRRPEGLIKAVVHPWE